MALTKITGEGIDGGTITTKTAGGTDNLILGSTAGDSIASGGIHNTCIGNNAGTAITTGVNNTAIGSGAGDALTDADYNTALGAFALTADTQGNKSTAVGWGALQTANTTSSGDAINTSVGYEAGKCVTTAVNSTFIGGMTGYSGTLTGNNNVALGTYALYAVNGSANRNTALGYAAGQTITTGDNNIAIGENALRTGRPGGEVTTGDNVIGIGNADHTASHIQVDWTVASDERDKTDFKALDIGLDFVKALAPVTYKWDKRAKYGDRYADDYDISKQTPDGTHKEDWLDVGFKAQEVEKLEKAAGYKIADKTNLLASLSEDGKQYGMQYSKFVPVLTKAVQELSTALDAAVARIKKLEDG